MVTNAAIAKNELLDDRLEKTKKLFYQELGRKKRNIKRRWFEINCIINEHCLQTLPYRSMLKHVGDLTEERRLMFSQFEANHDGTVTLEDNTCCDDDSSRVRIRMNSELDDDEPLDDRCDQYDSDSQQKKSDDDEYGPPDAPDSQPS